jgi:hypothetical protein
MAATRHRDGAVNSASARHRRAWLQTRCCRYLSACGNVLSRTRLGRAAIHPAVPRYCGGPLSIQKLTPFVCLVRKQYHFRRSVQGLMAWDIDRLVALSKNLNPEQVPLLEIREIDEAYWSNEGTHSLTCRDVVEHARLISEADLAYPVILSSNGRVMDGMHRIAKALLEGRTHIAAIRFPDDPEPDYVDVHPDDLPY